MARTKWLSGMLPLGVAIVAILALIALSGIGRTPEPRPVAATPPSTELPTTSPDQAIIDATTTTEGEGAEPTTTVVDLVAAGESLAARNGCAVCHISRGAPTVGPEWAGLFGTIETFTDGSTGLVDDAYLAESILDPNARIVEGYSAGVMPPTFADTLSDDDVAALIAYIQSLG